MGDITGKWTKECTSKEDLLELVMVERFQRTLNSEIQVHLREKKPKTLEEAALIADSFVEARRLTNKTFTDSAILEQAKRFRCQKSGHIAKN